MQPPVCSFCTSVHPVLDSWRLHSTWIAFKALHSSDRGAMAQPPSVHFRPDAAPAAQAWTSPRSSRGTLEPGAWSTREKSARAQAPTARASSRSPWSPTRFPRRSATSLLKRQQSQRAQPEVCTAAICSLQSFPNEPMARARSHAPVSPLNLQALQRLAESFRPIPLPLTSISKLTLVVTCRYAS